MTSETVRHSKKQTKNSDNLVTRDGQRSGHPARVADLRQCGEISAGYRHKKHRHMKTDLIDPAADLTRTEYT
jgi:hypothetical protein